MNDNITIVTTCDDNKKFYIRKDLYESIEDNYIIIEHILFDYLFDDIKQYKNIIERCKQNIYKFINKYGIIFDENNIPTIKSFEYSNDEIQNINKEIIEIFNEAVILLKEYDIIYDE